MSCVILPILSIVITILTIVGAVKILTNILDRDIAAVVYIVGIIIGFLLMAILF